MRLTCWRIPTLLTTLWVVRPAKGLHTSSVTVASQGRHYAWLEVLLDRALPAFFGAISDELSAALSPRGRPAGFSVWSMANAMTIIDGRHDMAAISNVSTLIRADWCSGGRIRNEG